MQPANTHAAAMAAPIASNPRAPSWYSHSLQDDPVFPSLDSELRADVCVIGGGLTGVATALELSQKGYKVVLLEANRIGWGASGRNGGQVTGSLSGDQAMLKQWRKTMGNQAADFIWDLRWRGHAIIRSRIDRYAINCDLKTGHLHAAYKRSHCRELQQTYDVGCARGMQDDLKLLDEQNVLDYIGTSLYHGGLYNRRNLHLHSLKLCLGEAQAAAQQGALVFEGSEVISIQHGATPIAQTRNGSVKADTLVIAGNAYHRLERNLLSGLLFPAALANLTTEPLSDEIVAAINPRDLAVYDTRFVLDYYAIEKTFPQLTGVKIDYEWTGQAGITINRLPQLGRLSDNVYYAQGYSGHGIATSHIVAEILAEAISGTMQEFDYFAGLKHVRLPLGEKPGQLLLSLGMLYYRIRERIG